MKKTDFIFYFLMFISINVNGQNSYLNVSLGYGLSTSSGQVIRYNQLYTSSSEANYELADIRLGEGASANLNFGINLNKYMSVELNATYLLGNSSEHTVDFTQSNWLDYKNTAVFSSNMLQISPMFVFSLNDNDDETNIIPYMKAGVTMGFGSIIEKRNTENGTNTGQPNFYEVDLKYSGGIALGFNGAIGAQYKLNLFTSLFGEIHLLDMSYKPNSGKVTEYIYNGTSTISSLSTNESEIEFVTSLTEDLNGGNQNQNEPRKELAMFMPYNNIALRLGLSFKF